MAGREPGRWPYPWPSATVSRPDDIDRLAPKAQGQWRAVIETPQGSRNKLKFLPADEVFQISESLPAGMLMGRASADVDASDEPPQAQDHRLIARGRMPPDEGGFG